MRATITVRMDNAAFDPHWPTELARILRELATRIDNEAPRIAHLRDINGNTVGVCRVFGANK